ncbi:DEAD/DEAH box helicase [Marinobacterium mangrovicola]|uniref:Protein translocase subunit SecA n=1 Tax=Marinobacterium mangrovicola TaxID=1476959 RepID=A0A4R1GJX7_9GAMM|nr:DEAD/DEAH box helicase [Marinobacterium mangrovicola]TCK07581.1 protein translocase subunit secA [Marinobacterium mangrovicola]
MSDTGFLLPPLCFHDERSDPGLSWSDRAEARLTGIVAPVNDRLERYRTRSFITRIGVLEDDISLLDDQALSEELTRQRQYLRREGLKGDAVVRTFALLRVIAERQLKKRPFDVQLQGAHALLNGRVAEMGTGEGKTLTASLAAATAALAGIRVHVVTVNDYLAQRDQLEMSAFYTALGLRSASVVHETAPEQRRQAYASDIVYVSNKEVAFDYLRDRLVLGSAPSNIRMKLGSITHQAQQTTVMRGLHFAIVDEADSVLVDEARTPLIISKKTDAAAEKVWAEAAWDLAALLEQEVHFSLDPARRQIQLTEKGKAFLADQGEQLGGVWRGKVRREDGVRQALMARLLFHRGEHYLVVDGRVQIVDEYTGRVMEDRSWSDGLHQIIEVKEGCEVTSRKLAVARMTYQRFFRRYKRLAGMTGTAAGLADELRAVYRLPVTRIPPNRASQRKRHPACYCRTQDDKMRLIVAEAAALQEAGRPVLIGTRSVLASEQVSSALSDRGIEHVVLNAAQDQEEAQIIAEAGWAGRVTVATNMAGRGVDIRLGPGVHERGGLHVILSERHDVRRIDLQLEGRCGRQGDPGSTRVLLSMEDPLLEALPGRQLWFSLARLPGLKSMILGLAFSRAQRRVERSHSRVRKELMAADQRLSRILALSGGME